MGRPIENNAEYFTHDKDMRNDLRIKAVRSRYGFDGYGIYTMMLEVLSDQQFFKLKFDDVALELLAGDFQIEAGRLKEILEYMDRLGLFQIEGEGRKSLRCKKLEERMQVLLDKRNKWRKLKERQIQEGFRKENAEKKDCKEELQRENNITEEFSREKTLQSKEKESKEKEKKENNSSNDSTAGADSFSEEDSRDGEDIGKLFIRTFSRIPNYADRIKTENLIKEFGNEKTEKAFYTAREKLGEKINLAYITGILTNEANGITRDDRRREYEQRNGTMGKGTWQDRGKNLTPVEEELARWQEYLDRKKAEDQNQRNSEQVSAERF